MKKESSIRGAGKNRTNLRSAEAGRPDAISNARFVSRMLGNHVLGKALRQETRAAQAGDRQEKEADQMAGLIGAGAGTESSSHDITASGTTPGIQAKADASPAPSSVADTSSMQALGVGEPMKEGRTRSTMERSFGADFSGVRLHRDNNADRLCRLLGAKALTQGEDIYFQKRFSNVDTPQGNRLLAHELTHTLQQGGGRIRLAPDHTVQDKETLYSIAKLYGLSVADLQTANGLKGTTINKGDVLKVPNPATYTVKPKETLYAIASRFGVSVKDLKTLNGLKSDAINSGDVLKIPSAATAVKHTVTGKDTLYSIAKRYGVSVAAIQKANGLSGATIHPGDVLTIPGAAPSAPAKAPPKAPAKAPAKPPAASPPAATPAKTPSAPLATGGTGTFPGHEPGKEYASGKVLERSFARKADLSAILTESSKQVFFEAGTDVTLKSSKGMWVEVSGEAFTDTAAPKKIMSGKSPKRITGWIKREWTDMTRGRFTELDIDDRSHFKDKKGAIDHVGYDSELPKADVKNIVMHQTGSLNAASTIADYQNRVLKGSSIATHYLIGRDGQIFLTGGVDRLIDHVGPPTGTVRSANALGIEHAGKPHTITAPAVDHKHKDFAKEMAKVRTEVKGLDLSPELEKTLLAKSDKDLYFTLKWSGWEIYEDISARQKRASHLLTRNLRVEFGIGAGGLHAHEKVSKKTLGEGENITEFHQAMEDYPGKVKQLETLSTGITALRAIVAHEKNVLQAVTLDATKSENEALAKEKAAKTAGAATVREGLRTDFYADFYQRMAQLNDMILFLTKAAGKPDTTELDKKVKAWKK